MPRHVFVSHASVNADLARRICDGLESRGLACWIAPRNVAFDGTYGTEIMKGLRECDVFLIVVTGASAESPQVEREAERAAHYRKRIIPVIIDGSELGPRLEFYVAGRQQFPCTPVPDERFMDGLADAIRLEPSRHTAPPSPQPSFRRKVPLLAAGAVITLVAAVTALYFNFDAGSPSSPSAPAAAVVSQRDTIAADSTIAQTPKQTASREPAATGSPSAASSAQPQAASAAPASVPGTSTAAVSAAVVNGVRLRFVAIPAGDVRMGCSAGDNECQDDEKPVRRVSVDSMQMSATEVTQEFWETVMGSNPSDFKGPTLPVEHISWLDSQDFVEALNRRRDGYAYRMPTEPEWEYAARAGDSAPPNLPAVAWFGLASSSARSSRPQNVGTKAPNRWGLYDTLGNVAEWCEDWYSPNYQRSVRGGSWVDGASSLRLSARGQATPTTRDYSIGLRLVRQPQ